MSDRTVCELPGQALAQPGDAFPDPPHDLDAADDRGEAILAGGCFWCTEAVFTRIDGVTGVQPGYAGGDAATADYKTVCGGRTGHAEVIRITYDPARTRFGQLLKVFFAAAHDPTQKDRQGNDVGTQYRSAIFPLDAAQERVARDYIAALDAAGVFRAPIATTVEPGHPFHVAEAYHHDYAAKNPDQPYIRGVSLPKVAKLQSLFPARLK